MIDITVPSPGESVTEVIIDNWLKADGDWVEKDELIAEIQSDKAMLELYAEAAGVLSLKAGAGDTVEVGTVIAQIDETASKPAGSNNDTKETPSADNKADDKPATKDAPATDTPQKETYATGEPSASAAKLIREHDLDASKIKGTGRDGRITKEDVLKAIEDGSAKKGGAPASSKPASKEVPAQPHSQPAAYSREASRKAMSALRKTIARRLVSVKNETAMLTTFNEVDMTAIMAIRKSYKERFKEVHEVGLGFMGFFTKAVTMALHEFPAVNSQIDGDDLVTPAYVDMGIAVSTDRGLMVPIIRNAESKPLDQIERDVMDIAIRARDGKITLDEMTGGTFTITNGGVFGSLMSTPILNPPQSAILGMHKIEQRPIAVDGQLVIKPMMYVALSYDHRVIDGKESVSFLVRVKEYLEDPVRLLLGV